MFRKLLVLGVLGLSTALVAVAQGSRSEVSIVGSGAFTTDANGAGISQRASNGGGFGVGYRFNLNRWAAIEGNYSYTRHSEYFRSSSENAGIESTIHFATADFVLKLPIFSDDWRPYVLAGSGALIFDPTSNNVISGASVQSRPAFVYGGGVDFDVTRHVALRAEYRGYVYQAPNFDVANFKSDATTHLAQPSAGIVFRF